MFKIGNGFRCLCSGAVVCEFVVCVLVVGGRHVVVSLARFLMFPTATDSTQPATIQQNLEIRVQYNYGSDEMELLNSMHNPAQCLYFITPLNHSLGSSPVSLLSPKKAEVGCGCQPLSKNPPLRLTIAHTNVVIH
jgi:hypothetical protein